MQQPIYSVHPPPKELEEFVRNFIVANETQATHGKSHAKPTGCNYLGWFVDGQAKVEYGDNKQVIFKKDFWHVSGQIYQLNNIDMHYGGSLKHILIEFTPTGLYRLFGIDGSAMVDELHDALSLNSKLKNFCTKLNKQASMLDLSDIDTRIELINNALIEQISSALTVPEYLQRGIDILIKTAGIEKITNIVEQLNVSERQFNRKFTQVVGIPPKFYAKVIQMNRALQAILENDTDYLSNIAQRTGFYDQSHLNHVIKEFFESSPNEFLQSGEQILFTFLGRDRQS